MSHTIIAQNMANASLYFDNKDQIRDNKFEIDRHIYCNTDNEYFQKFSKSSPASIS